MKKHRRKIFEFLGTVAGIVAVSFILSIMILIVLLAWKGIIAVWGSIL